MGRAGCFMICLVIFLFVKGGQESYTAVTNWSPVEMTCDEYMKKNPKGLWYKLKDCTLDIPGATYMTKYGSISEVYIPVYGIKPTGKEPVKMILATKDDAIMALVSSMKEVKGEKQALEFMLKNGEKLYPKRDIEGVVRYGMDMKDKDRSKIASLNSNLDPNFVILSDGEKPSLLLGFGMLAGGCILVVILLGSQKKTAVTA